MQKLTHWKRHWCWERLKAGGEGDDRGWDGWHHQLSGCELSNLREMVKDRESRHAAIHEVAKSWTRLSNWIMKNRGFYSWGKAMGESQGSCHVISTLALKPVILKSSLWISHLPALRCELPLENNDLFFSSIFQTSLRSFSLSSSNGTKTGKRFCETLFLAFLLQCPMMEKWY